MKRLTITLLLALAGAVAFGQYPAQRASSLTIDDPDTTVPNPKAQLKIETAGRVSAGNLRYADIESYVTGGSGGAHGLTRIRTQFDPATELGTDLLFQTQASAYGDDPVTRLFVGHDGKVGIGTAGPTSELEVANSSNDERLQVDTTTDGKVTLRSGDWGSAMELTTKASGGAANGGQLYLLSSGDVSIGTYSDYAKLAVGGTLMSAGTLQAGAPGVSPTSYNRIGDAVSQKGLSSGLDLLVSGNAEVQGSLYANGGQLEGAKIQRSSSTASSIDPTLANIFMFSANTDFTLSSIAGGAFEGQVIRIMNTGNTGIITIPATVGDILTNGGNNISLAARTDSAAAYPTVSFMWDGTSWIEISRNF